MPSRSPGLAPARRRQASPTGCASRWRTPPDTRAVATTSSRSSTPCTISEIRSARPGTPGGPWPPPAPAWSAAGASALIASFDALPDLGDPVGAAGHARAALADDGSCMLVEPFAGDRIEDNLNPVGRMYYGFSTLVCTPGSLSQPGRAGLGTQAGQAAVAEVLLAGGFGSVRRAAATPLSLVLGARLEEDAGRVTATLIGRRTELETLERALGSARSGRG